MVDTGFKEATNKIVVSGTPIVVEKEVEIATNMYPGRLVKRGTTDNEVVVNDTDDNAYGWLGYEQTGVNYRPANKDTIYSAADRVGVIVGGDIVILGRLASGQNVTMGAKLTAAANGELTVATIGTHMVLATAMESVDASGGAADILVRSLL